MNQSDETTTCLYREQRVRKDHPRIMFRGALDGLYAQTICCQLDLQRQGEMNDSEKLTYILKVIRDLMDSEYSGETMDLLSYELDWELLYDASHRPMQHYGIGHPVITAQMGQAVASLNLLRTKVRECERLAVAAFDGERLDIVHALNRMSSAIYAFLCEIIAKGEGHLCR